MQEEVDELWAKLSAGGAEQPCGWLKDRFGLSWQIVPAALGEILILRLCVAPTINSKSGWQLVFAQTRLALALLSE